VELPLDGDITETSQRDKQDDRYELLHAPSATGFGTGDQYQQDSQ
jgi:hypothetical protein